MDRAKWIGSLMVVGLLAGPALAVGQAPEPPPLSAGVETCTTSALPAQRVVSFVGSMPAVKGAERMQMRFELQRRDGGEKLWHNVPAVKGFGMWASSLPARAGFIIHKLIDGLQVPAAYRAIVRFRWLAADGTVVRKARKRTPACDQPDLRPDIAPGALRAVLDARPALAVYSLTVRNQGRSPSGPFAVRVAGAVSEVAGLGAGQQVEVTIVAPACVRGATVRAVVDADRRIDEADEHNALRRTCPLA